MASFCVNVASKKRINFYWYLMVKVMQWLRRTALHTLGTFLDWIQWNRELPREMGWCFLQEVSHREGTRPTACPLITWPLVPGIKTLYEISFRTSIFPQHYSHYTKGIFDKRPGDLQEPEEDLLLSIGAESEMKHDLWRSSSKTEFPGWGAMFCREWGLRESFS